MKREQLADLILSRLKEEENSLKMAYRSSFEGIGHFYIDDLLPEKTALEIYEHFPLTRDAVQKKSLREFKHVAVQMDRYHTLLEEIVYAFQDSRIVSFVKELCEIDSLEPDPDLYAGGLSIMEQHNFLNPHLDNSHDKDRNRWRVLNLLYYVSPDWKLENGGNLELWPGGLDSEAVTVVSRFNRLVVMATHQRSWHSVSKVLSENRRCCVSNYYFSESPLLEDDKFHVTSFRAWPGQRILDMVLKTDSKLRMGIRRIFNKGIRENPHVYKKKNQ